MIGFRPQSLCGNLLEGDCHAYGRNWSWSAAIFVSASALIHAFTLQLRNVFVMRAIWKGSISFGLVNIPIALYPATRKEELKFRLLRAKDLSPVNY